MKAAQSGLWMKKNGSKFMKICCEFLLLGKKVKDTYILYLCLYYIILYYIILYYIILYYIILYCIVIVLYYIILYDIVRGSVKDLGETSAIFMNVFICRKSHPRSSELG